MRINKRVQDLKVGDKIVTDFFQGEENIVRTITELFDNVPTGSGRGVIFDAGEKCPCCGKYAGTPLKGYPKSHDYLDAAWVILI
jgi:hypothetical protein